MVLLPLLFLDCTSEYGGEPSGNQDEEGREQSRNRCEKGGFGFFDLTRPSQEFGVAIFRPIGHNASLAIAYIV